MLKLALISAKFPYGGKEPYLQAELRALAPHFASITVMPTSPTDRTWGFSGVAGDVRRYGWFTPRTLIGAAVALCTRPRGSMRALGGILGAHYPLRVKLKNLVVVPLGLAIGNYLRRGDYGHVHSYWLSTPSTVAYIAAHVAGLPWSSTGHLWDIYENNALALKLLDARFVRAISQRGRTDLLAALHEQRDAADVRVIHVGVHVPAAPPGEGATLRPLALLCAANLVRKKGHRDLLDALAVLRAQNVAFTCAIAGDGELRAELEAHAARLELGTLVSFRGHVSHAVLLDEMHAGRYDAMVLPSLELPGGVMEGIPVALMEAMAAGLPVVTTHTGSIGELVDASCGRVVAQSSPDVLARALAELAGDPVLRARLGAAAYERVRASFNVEVVAAELARAIATLPAAYAAL